MTSRPPTRPETHLRAAYDIIDSVRVAWPAYQATESYRTQPTLRAAGGSETGRGSDVPDPVYGVVASFEQYEETCAMVAELAAQARVLQRRMFAVIQEHPRVAQEALQHMKSWRCDGEFDPTCTRLAVSDRGKHKGKCSACIRGIQRAEQAKRDAEEGNAA